MLKKQKASRTVGAKQVLRALAADRLQSVLLAVDAPMEMQQMIRDAAKKAQVPITECPSMAALGKMCQVEVPSVAAGIFKEDTQNA